VCWLSEPGGLSEGWRLHEEGWQEVTAIKITKFLGVAPKNASELLPDTAAQVARNCMFRNAFQRCGLRSSLPLIHGLQ
jgi:hypothetical protein